MSKKRRNFILFLFLPMFLLILSGCGNKNLTNSQNSIVNTNSSATSLTLVELAKHNSPTDCWQLINGQVYDLTSYISSGTHPNNQINDGCGQEATALFASIAKHNGKAEAMLPRYLLGPIQP